MVLLLALASIAADAQAEPNGLTTVRPTDTGEALVNPGMGWTLHYYSNIPTNYGSRLEPSDTVDDFPGLSTVYLRIPWSYIEPEEGVFCWAVVDGPAQRWIAKGKQVAFRFSCSESWMRWATPEWVAKAGGKGYNFTPGREDPNGPFWEPDYDDPVFLEKLDHFLAAAAARYDGKPEVAFIDVGSFGVWGEGHLFASTQRKYPASTVIRHIDLHLKHFHQTLLAANDDFSFQGDETIEYARQKGLILRDDSILVQAGENAYFQAAMAQGFWPTGPVVLECEHYGGSKQRGAWGDGSLYLKAVEDYHASFAAIHWWPREFLEANRDLIGRINRRLGYRIQLVEAQWPDSIRLGERLRFRSVWRNAGVAPCYAGGFPALTLLDSHRGIVTVLSDEDLNVRDLQVGPPDQAPEMPREREFILPMYVRPGTYDLYISVGDRDGTPRIALPLADGDGARRYRLGKLTVTGDYSVTAGALEQRGDKWLLPLTCTTHFPAAATVAPFLHFDLAGAIAFQGTPVGGAGVFAEAGTRTVGCEFAIPPEAFGRSFGVLAGLWDPERLAQPDERLHPDSGEQDRRVILGTLTVAADGSPTFTETGAAEGGR